MPLTAGSCMTVDLNVTAQAEQIAKLVEAIAEDNSAELEQRIFICRSIRIRSINLADTFE